LEGPWQAEKLQVEQAAATAIAGVSAVIALTSIVPQFFEAVISGEAGSWK